MWQSFKTAYPPYKKYNDDSMIELCTVKALIRSINTYGGFMKSVFQGLGISVVLLTASMSFGFDRTSVLSKTVSPGFSPPYASTSLSCELFRDSFGTQLHVTKSVGSVGVAEIRNVTVEGDLVSLIAAAAKGTVTEGRGPTDLPTTRYSARDADNKEVELWTDGSVKRSNSSNEAKNLIALLDQICP